MKFVYGAKKLFDDGALGKISMVKALWNWHFTMPRLPPNTRGIRMGAWGDSVYQVAQFTAKHMDAAELKREFGQDLRLQQPTAAQHGGNRGRHPAEYGGDRGLPGPDRAWD